MAQTVKSPSQSKPSAGTSTDLYTVPGATTAVVTSITVCNQDAAADTFRISVAVGGGALDVKDYLYFDEPVLGTKTFAVTLGLTLGAGDIVRVRSTNGTCSFNLFKVEYT